MPRPFAVIGIAFFLTLAMLSYLDADAAVVLLTSAGICFIPLLCIKSARQTAVIPSALLAIVAGCIMFIAADEFSYKPAVALTGENIAISGEIIDLPRKENNRFYYIIKTSAVNEKHIKVKIRLSSTEPLDAEPYDRIETEATVYILGDSKEDSLQYYKTTGIYLGAYSFADVAVIPQQNKPAMYHILNLKQNLIRNINELLPNETGGLIAALLFGDKSFMDDKTLADFGVIGISHVAAISGLNLSIFLLIFLDIFERLKLNKRIVYFASSFFVILVMALAGFSASVLRAGFMLLVLIVGKVLNKEADALNSIGLSVLLISFFNPLGAGYVGLQLSFFATIGIIIWQKRLMKPFDKIADKITRTSFRHAVKFVFETGTVTVSAFVFTLPTIILTFEKVALIAVLSNLLLVYTSTLTMIFGGIAAIAYGIPTLSFISYPFALLAGLIAKYILKCSEFLADIPFASVGTSDTYIKLWLSAVFVLLALSIYFVKKHNVNLLHFSGVLSAALLFIGITANILLNRGLTEITVASVGNASAAVIARNGHSVLVGCGGDDYAVNSIYDALESSHTDTIDLLLIPRAEFTESQAASNIVRRYKVNEIIVPALNFDLEFISELKGFKVSQKERVALWNNSTLDYLFTNDLSCAYAVLDGTTVLFVFYPGSKMEQIPEEWKNADILVCRSKVPQGLDCLNFGSVIISAEETAGNIEAEFIRSAGGNAVVTSPNGNVIIRSRGESIYSIGRKN